MRVFACLLLTALCVRADLVVLKGGKKIEGKVVSEQPEVVVNPYNSGIPAMTFGVERFPASRVKKIVRTIPNVAQAFQLRLAEVAGADACVELATWCATNKLKEQRLMALEKALSIDPGHEQARKLLGSKAPPKNRADQLKQARKYIAAPDEEAPALLAEALKNRTFPFDEDYLQRARRSKSEARGYIEDKPVTMRADKLGTNARYTLFVPQGYDPLEPTPLLFGLHGGGAGGADRKLVVGSGPHAMPFYRGQCGKRGWIAVCPTALQAGWGGLNHDFIDAILDELRALYNIDENRIYLTGHSMGGGGTWVQGTRIPEVWAAIAPTASYGVRGIDQLKKTRTGFYVYHSDDDPRTRIGGVRQRMKGLPGQGIDFVYTELTGRGHSLPGEIIQDLFEFFEVRRRAVAPRFRAAARPLSSFERKISKDEKKYLPLEEKGGRAGDSYKPLIKKLRAGGGIAEKVVAPLVQHKDPGVNGSVAKVLLSNKSAADVRRYAAKILGGRKATDQVKALGRALLIENESNALLAVLEAIGEINDPAAGPALLSFLKKRQHYFKERRMGERMHHSDWTTILPTMAQACSLLGTYKTPKASRIINIVVIEGVFLSATEVLYDRAIQNPMLAARALVGAACQALIALKDASVVPSLEKLSRRDPWDSDSAVAAQVRLALEALKG